uniref:Uncharacterized protein n=1 Tax=Erpetoichthys calabaricus TaxID=27687 RepID=A0A8C4TI18_ERPCA
MITTLATEIKELKKDMKKEINDIRKEINDIRKEIKDVDKQTIMTQIEIAEQLASTSDRKAMAADSECKILGDRLAALEDGCRRNTIRIKGLPENRESPNPVKFVAEVFSKIIGENFKSDTEIAAAYPKWNTDPDTFLKIQS